MVTLPPALGKADTLALRLQTALGVSLGVERMVVEEGISRPFRIELDLVSLEGGIDGAKALRTPMTVTLQLDGGAQRHFHGVVARFAQLGRDAQVVRYRAELVPTLQLLALSRDHRVFQNLTPPQIVEHLLEAGGVADFELQLYATYERRAYCVQYGESTLDFIHRLLEDEGISYYFRHEARRHVLVLFDQSSVLPTVAGEHKVPYRGDGDVSGPSHLATLVRERALHAGAVRLREYNFETPSTNLESALGQPAEGELYAYPGG